MATCVPFLARTIQRRPSSSISCLCLLLVCPTSQPPPYERIRRPPAVAHILQATWILGTATRSKSVGSPSFRASSSSSTLCTLSLTSTCIITGEYASAARWLLYPRLASPAPVRAVKWYTSWSLPWIQVGARWTSTAQPRWRVGVSLQGGQRCLGRGRRGRPYRVTSTMRHLVGL